MMKKNLWIICLMVFVFILSSTDVWVEEKKVDSSKDVELFIQVVSYGEAKKDPLVMMSAVRMLDALPFDSITDEGSGVRYERGPLLDKAKEYASGDKEVLAMIANLQEEKTTVRGPQHLPQYHYRPQQRGHGGGYYGGGPGCAPHRDYTWTTEFGTVSADIGDVPGFVVKPMPLTRNVGSSSDNVLWRHWLHPYLLLV